MEPTGVGINDNVLVHDIIVDNSEGRTRLAFAIVGTVDNSLTGFALNNVRAPLGASEATHRGSITLFATLFRNLKSMRSRECLEH